MSAEPDLSVAALDLATDPHAPLYLVLASAPRFCPLCEGDGVDIRPHGDGPWQHLPCPHCAGRIPLEYRPLPPEE